MSGRAWRDAVAAEVQPGDRIRDQIGAMTVTRTIRAVDQELGGTVLLYTKSGPYFPLRRSPDHKLEIKVTRDLS